MRRDQPFFERRCFLGYRSDALREDLMKRGSFLREQMRTDLKGAVKNERRKRETEVIN